MLCDVCREGLEGIWDPENSRRLGLLKYFPDILEFLFREVEDGNYDEVLSKLKLQEEERYVFGHHVNYDSLVKSKELGCVVCNIFDESNDHDDINATFAERGYYSVFQVILPRSNMPNPVMAIYTGETVQEIPHTMIAHDENDHVNSAISHSTSDTPTCLETHKSCIRQASELFAPTRLLELQYVGTEKKFRLVLQSEFDPRERYITLSHCWGPKTTTEKLQLTKSTLEDLRNGLLVAILPKTFRDAFEIIERLKVRYLWIDRLCIVQDSVEDWQSEASIMGPVYTHGLLNIAALGATDDQTGCFFDRDPALVSPTIINLSPPGDSVAAFYRFEAEEEAWKRDFEGQPLLSRAWVLQERILSTRNLYFGSKQVFWECLEAYCSETVPNTTLGEWDSSRSSIHSLGPDDHRWKSLLHPKSNGSIPKTDWPHTVQIYSQCNLTFPSDKLVAISGLAKRMGSVMRKKFGSESDVYLAGLWKHMMPKALLWRPKVRACRVSPYRAPSWSWASLDGEVSCSPSSHIRWHADVLGAKITPHADDLAGKVISGTITLRGHICTARNMRLHKESPVDYDIYIIGSFHHPNTESLLEFGDSKGGYLQFDTVDDFHETVVILMLGFDISKAYSFVTAHGLALVPADESRTSYRRVGCASLKETVDFEDFKDCDIEKVIYSELPLETIKII
ncbi:HET-domain-containing protein [Daldinia loculata]|uniref:HET-domain-containing protein n=1 Tax=Daldinia loculata TaxID=103429 RepID=UPI0020C29FE3|nr:HET-domain-containing protein [Daldinia loculata]KAI1644627.1 HET-domain-containing protein [Daldinia loculata]